MRLAFYTYSYTDKLGMPTALCLERIAKTGYSGIDVSGTHGNSDDPNSFDADLRRLTRATAKRLGLRVEGIITHAALTASLFDGEKKPLDLKGSVDLAVDLGGELVTFHMGGYPDGIPRDDVWKRTVKFVREAADYAAARHVGLAVDGIWFDWLVESPDSLARLFADVASPNFGVNFDPCYLKLMGIDPAVFAGRFQKNLLHAHLKDHRLEAPLETGAGRPPKWTHLLPGRGEMDYARVFKTLAALKFDRACAVECFTDMKFKEACDGCSAALSAAAARAGVWFMK